MNIYQIRDYCLSLPNVEESMTFGPNHLVFKTFNKMFLLVGLDESPIRFNVKCDPERAVLLREEFEDVQPGWHSNKKHWNTVFMNGSLSDRQLIDMIDHSYDLIINKLPKNRRF